MESIRLDAPTARAFLERLGENVEHNVNVMDREGVIIASRDPARVGGYHEAARRLVATGRDVEAVRGEGLAPGVKPGVNLPIRVRGETIGVVGVTGEPDQVSALAYAVKTSVETMMELELVKRGSERRQAGANRLAAALTRREGAEPGGAEALARKLGYDPAVPRAPAILVLEGDRDPDDALRELKASGARARQDIAAPTADGDLVVFRALSLGGRDLFADYESQASEFAEAALRACGGGRACVGMFQVDFSRYREAYAQALWLRSLPPERNGRVLLATRRLGDYLASLIPRAEWIGAFEAAESLLGPRFRTDHADLLRELDRTGFNLGAAAERLGLHRNTVAARLEKLSAALGADPRTDARTADACRWLARYFAATDPVHRAQS